MTSPMQGEQFRGGQTGYTNDAALFEDEIDLKALLIIAKRRWRLLVIGLLLGAALGLAYAISSTPLYTASVRFSLDANDADAARESAGFETQVLREDQIRTEIEIIQSEAIAQKVVDALNLSENSTFMTAPQTGTQRLIGLAKGLTSQIPELLSNAAESASTLPSIPQSDVDITRAKRDAAVSRLRNNMNVQRVDRSRIIEVRFTTLSPTLAARVTNAIAEIYIADQVEAKYGASQQAVGWLQERVEDLQQQVIARDNEIEQFRIDNDIVSVDGNLQSGAELDRLNARVEAKRAELVSLVAQRDRLEDIVAQGDTSAAVSATSTQAITSSLRAQFLETLRNYNTLSEQLGENHAQTRRLFDELGQIQTVLFEEIKRSAEVTNNEVALAREELDRLQDERTRAEAQVGQDNAVLVQLREMERNANSVRGLYANFLERYQTLLQEQSFTVSSARIINAAQIPSSPSAPKTERLVALASIFGFMLAAGYIAIREAFDDRLRVERDVREKLGMEYIGGLPSIKAQKSLRDRMKGEPAPAPREIRFPEIERYAADNPLSPYAEVIRSTRMATSIRLIGKKTQTNRASEAPCIAIGFVSCFPNEGKTTTSSNVANLLAKQGKRVMLIDGDLRNPGLTRSLKGDVEKGFVDILTEDADWRDMYYTDPELGTHVLPSRSTQVFHTSELLQSDQMIALMSDLRNHYDYIIVDLPPLGPVIDARAILPLIDGLVFVAKWGETRIKQVRSILRQDERLRSQSFGLILNMYDPKKARGYGDDEMGAYYYGEGYNRYYQTR